MCHTHASAARSNINAASNSSAVLHLASLYRAVFVGHVHAGSAANEYAGSSNEHACPYEHAETAANLDGHAGSTTDTDEHTSSAHYQANANASPLGHMPRLPDRGAAEVSVESDKHNRPEQRHGRGRVRRGEDLRS